MVCLGSEGAYEYVEEFVFGGSLVWYRIAEIWCFGTCTVIDLNHVATYYYAVEMRDVMRGIDCGRNGEKLAWSVWKGI